MDRYPARDPPLLSDKAENPTLKLLETAPQDRLLAWLAEFYGKSVRIRKREVLRHRDFSFVERLVVEEALPESVIYKLVQPPWDIEQDLHERILIPSISSSPQLYMTAHYEKLTALFLEDLGNEYLKDDATVEDSKKLGEDLARMQRAYSYRVEELSEIGVLRFVEPHRIDTFVKELIESFTPWGNIRPDDIAMLERLAFQVSENLADEPISLVHGDLYAENIARQFNRLYILDWSWFTCLGPQIIDLVTITSSHAKNGALRDHRQAIMESYCDESGRSHAEIEKLVPYGYALERLTFLSWLSERKQRGVFGTTVGHVDDLIAQVTSDLAKRMVTW